MERPAIARKQLFEGFARPALELEHQGFISGHFSPSPYVFHSQLHPSLPAASSVLLAVMSEVREKFPGLRRFLWPQKLDVAVATSLRPDSWVGQRRATLRVAERCDRRDAACRVSERSDRNKENGSLSWFGKGAGVGD